MVLKLEKYEFLLKSIEYLGHVITKDGIEPVPCKVEVIKSPNVQQLTSFLGLINYYKKFILNLSTLLHLLNSLLQSNKKWCWSTECSKAFQNAKEQLTSACVL